MLSWHQQQTNNAPFELQGDLPAGWRSRSRCIESAGKKSRDLPKGVLKVSWNQCQIGTISLVLFFYLLTSGWWRSNSRFLVQIRSPGNFDHPYHLHILDFIRIGGVKLTV